MFENLLAKCPDCGHLMSSHLSNGCANLVDGKFKCTCERTDVNTCANCGHHKDDHKGAGCIKCKCDNKSFRKDLDKLFTHHVPKTKEVGESHSMVRELCRTLAESIVKICPDSRERSLAMTKLEEVMMWANASIARNQ